MPRPMTLPLRIVLILVIALAGGAAAWAWTAPGPKSFAAVARGLSFVHRDGRNNDEPLPTFQAPRQIEAVEVTRATSVGGQTPDSAGEGATVTGLDCRWGAEHVAGPAGTPPESARHADGPFVLLSPLQVHGHDCRDSVAFRRIAGVTELSFRAAGGKECRFGAEISFAGAPAAPRVVATPGMPEASCLSASSHAAAGPKSVPVALDGTVTLSTHEDALTVWDDPIPVAELALTLSQSGSFGFADESCAGNPGDLLSVHASQVTLTGIDLQPQGLSTRFGTSADWSVEIGGCQISGDRRHWKDALEVWFKGFLALGGVTLIATLLGTPRTPAAPAPTPVPAPGPTPAAGPAPAPPLALEGENDG